MAGPSQGVAGRMMTGQGQARRLMVLFLAILLLLNFPVLAIVDALQRTTGTPVVFVYVFGVWMLGIAGAALIVERRRG